jgi:hypothetical protein
MYDLNEMRSNPASRRGFLAAMTAAGLGAAAYQLFEPKPVRAASAATLSGSEEHTDALAAASFPGIPGNNIDVKVLNYALTLELLEADLYRQALNVASGIAIGTALNSNPDVYKRDVAPGGLSSAAANIGFDYLQEFAYVEAAHAAYLTTAITNLGATPVTANATGYSVPSGPGSTIYEILSNILPLEETGVRAYLGAVSSITLVGTYGQAAATIYSTEARHSASIRYLLKEDPGPVMMSGDLSVVANPPASNTFEYYLTPTTVISRIQAYINPAA